MPDGAALSSAAQSSAAPSSAVRSPHADDLPAQSSPPRDPWSIATLDLDAYLSRVGLADLGLSEDADDAPQGYSVRPPEGQLRPSGDTLAALHAAHLAAFPLENLDIM